MYCHRFDGERQFNDNNRQQNGFLLGPPHDFADSDVESPGTSKNCFFSFSTAVGRIVEKLAFSLMNSVLQMFFFSFSCLLTKFQVFTFICTSKEWWA